MGEPLRVDPAALSGAGSAVTELSNGLTAALGALTAAYNANTGQDAAGTSFGFAYQESARALVDAVAKGVNALRHIGYRIQGSATTYSRAEAAADIRGGAAPLPLPAEPAAFAAPSGDPDVNGPGRTPPVLWYLVEFLIGDLWPNGEPNQLHAAAAAWSALAGPLYAVTGQDAGPYGVIDAQQIPEKERMKAAVRDVGTAMSSLAGEAQTIASELNQFAADVEHTQNAIRDLLHKLESVVGSVVDKGILGTVFELVTGDAEEKIHEVADDIAALIAHHKQESAARKDLLSRLVGSIKNYSRAMEIFMRVELVQYLGEDAGRVAANVYDAATDTGVGVTLGAVNTVGGLATGFDPVGDPKGTLAMIEGLGKMAMIFNPMTAPVAFATDPQGSLDMVKNVTHFDDIFTSNRPFLGIGELAFDIGTAIVPGGAEIKAGTGARVAGEAAERSEIAAAERVAGEAGGIASAATGLRGVARDVEGVAPKLDDLERTTLGSGKQPSGAPGPLLKPPEAGVPSVGREPGPGAGGKPTSQPVEGHGAGGPTERVPGDPAAGNPGSGVVDVPKLPGEPRPSIVDVPPTSAERQAMAREFQEAHSASAAAPAESPGGGGSGLPSMSEGAGGHGAEATSPAGSGAGDRVPVAVGAHGAEGAADGAGHGPHSGTSHGGGSDSHGGLGSVGGGRGGGGENEHGGPVDHGSGSDHDGSTKHEDAASPTGANSGQQMQPIEGHDFAFTPEHALERLHDPGDEIARLREAGLPTSLLDDYEPLAGRTIDEYRDEFTISGRDGHLRWDWDRQAPNDGFAGEPTVARSIPEGHELDRVGSNGGAFLADSGAPLGSRGMPPGIADDYHRFVGTGQPIPEGVPWEVRFGPAKGAFGQPGGANQWVVIDTTDGSQVPVRELIDRGLLVERKDFGS